MVSQSQPNAGLSKLDPTRPPHLQGQHRSRSLVRTRVVAAAWPAVTGSKSSTEPLIQVASPIEMSWQWRIHQPASPIHSPFTISPATWALKKFGATARNPDCSCVHCLDHFARLRSIKESGFNAAIVNFQAHKKKTLKKKLN